MTIESLYNHIVMAEVKLLGTRFSHFSHRVIWALKLKGIRYEYIEEDLSNKSELLLQSNPVHKKIPVLIHGGKCIAESIVILEYIEETWPDTPLLPTDPHERAVARFWAKFADDKAASVVSKLLSSTGEEQERAVKESLEMLRAIEDHGPHGEKKFLGGDVMGLADLACGGIAHCWEVIEEAVGVKILEAHTFPRLHAWTNSFNETPVIKETVPERGALLDYIKHRRQMLLSAK